jgi:nitrate reductase NapAB chaperone NapD
MRSALRHSLLEFRSSSVYHSVLGLIVIVLETELERVCRLLIQVESCRFLPIVERSLCTYDQNQCFKTTETAKNNYIPKVP